MYSTKAWDIDSKTADRYNYGSPETRTLDTPDCDPNEGYAGFEVDVTRIFRKAGAEEVDHGEVPHRLHPQRHGDLQAARLAGRLRPASGPLRRDTPSR